MKRSYFECGRCFNIYNINASLDAHNHGLECGVVQVVEERRTDYSWPGIDD